MRAGVASGLLGGICCIAAAVSTVVATAGAAGWVSAAMQRYQPYFIGVSVVAMGVWLARQLCGRVIGPRDARRDVRRDVRAAAVAVGRQAVVMGAVYAATLGGAMVIAAVFGN